MSVLIGMASIDENGRAYGGVAGDQTGREVYVLPWYAGGWNVLLRAKSQAVAEKMAAACEILCKGNLVGYDQWNRNDLWDQLEKVGWDAAKLKVKTETDCSAFITALARVAGINVPRVSLGNGKYNAPVTQTMRQAFGSTGAFEVLTDPKYLTTDKYLKRGDVLVRESGHTVMGLSDGAEATSAEDTAQTVPQSTPHPSPSGTPSPQGEGIYTVVAGDTLWGIARRYGVTVDAICTLNGLNPVRYIYPGQKITIPKH